MNFLGNLIWLLFGCFATAICYFLGGVAMMATIIGIPFGFQMIKVGSLAPVALRSYFPRRRRLSGMSLHPFEHFLAFALPDYGLP